MMAEETITTNETQTFQCPRWYKRFFQISSVIFVCVAVWLYDGLFETFRDYNDWRAWLGYAICALVMLYFIYTAVHLIITTYSQITIDTEYILMKTPLSTVKIPWNSVLGVNLMHDDKAFRIIGVKRNIIFNAKDYADSDYLLELTKDKLSPVLNRDLPSISEDVLLDITKLVLNNRPGISPLKVYEKVLSVDSKLKYEEVKQLVKSLRNKL